MSEPLPRPDLQALLRHPVHLLAFGLGSGLVPRGPGTAGSLVAVPLYLLLVPLSLPVYGVVVAALFLVGIWLCGATARDLGVHDHPGIVWDEVVGMLVALAPAAGHWPPMLAGFLLFRLFDIAKPWPICWLDRRIGGGFGIMVDDLAAGVAAALVVYLLPLTPAMG